MHVRIPGGLAPRCGGWAALVVGALLGSAIGAQAQSGAVFTSTNSATGNAVAMFSRAANGALTPFAIYFTGGLGTGSSLGSQGAVALSKNGQWLFTVNAGSNDISVFSVKANGLKLVSRTPSGGTMPTSLTVWGNWLYVLNAGTPNNISGFTIGSNGSLTPISGSTEPLSTPSAGPAEVAFAPAGDLLVVTEKTTNTIDVFAVDGNGVASAPISAPSSGTEPYGFGFDKFGRLFVSEAVSGSVSSYYVSTYGLLPITESATDNQAAACWIAVHAAGDFVWTANAASKSISAYNIWPNGAISLLAGGGIVATFGAGVSDMAFDSKEKYLYEMESGIGTVLAFQINHDGTLNPIGSADGLDAGIAGLAAK